MKKLMSLLLAGIMVFTLVACDEGSGKKDKAKNDDFVGEWYAVSAEMDGDKAPEGVLEGIGMILEEDGTAQLLDDGDTSEGKWTADGNELTITNAEDEDEKIVLELKDEQLIMEEDGVVMFFERK